MTNKKPFNKNQRVSPTLYRNQTDLKKALELVSEELRSVQDGNPSIIGVDEEGFSQIEDVISFLNNIDGLDYVNQTHIIELFFKDYERKILINGEDRIKYKSVKYVKPPQTLFFGTIENLKGRMLESGLRSRTKGYIKLYATEEKAISFASKFATDPKDIVVTLAVDADKAFSEGLKFSTYIDDEFIVALVDKKYFINTKGEK